MTDHLTTTVAEALRTVHALISEAAGTGFNCHDGDWAGRLFASQGASFDALKRFDAAQQASQPAAAPEAAGEQALPPLPLSEHDMGALWSRYDAAVLAVERGQNVHGALSEMVALRELVETAARAAQAAQPLPAPAEGHEFDVVLDEDAADLLRQTIGDDEDAAPVRMLVGDGHSGYGLYLAQADYQEEGAVLLLAMPAREPMKAADEFELRRLLAEERETTRQLTRALAEATEGETFMGEPVIAAQPKVPQPLPESATRTTLVRDEREASAACPICGIDSPHAHTRQEVIAWLVAQAGRFMPDEIVVLLKKDYEKPALVHTGDSSVVTQTHCLLVPAEQRPTNYAPGTKFYLHPAALTQPAPEAAKGVPDGWKLVPIKATEAMQYAAAAKLGGDAGALEAADTAYRAMLAATPPAPEAQQAEPVGIVQALSIGGTPMANSTGVEWLRPVPLGAKLYAEPQQPAQAVPLTLGQIAVAFGWKPGFGPLDDEIAAARRVERACAEAWGVKLAGGGEGV